MFMRTTFPQIPALGEYKESTEQQQGVPVFFFNFYLFIYLFVYFLAVLGLRCCTQAFSSCGERGLLFVTVRRLLIEVASLVAEHGL